MRRRHESRAAATAAAATIALVALGGLGVASAGARPHHGYAAARHDRGETAGAGAAARHYHDRAARTIDGTDVAHLHLVHQHEAVLYEVGSAGGPLSGSMHAKLTVGSVFTGSFTIATKHGSVIGHGSAKPHGTGRYQSFRGTMYVTGGSGQYKHIHGKTSLYGTFDRRTFDVLLKTKGRLSY